MLRDFNLLVTTTRGSEADACSEIWYLLGEIGDNAAKVEKTNVSGLIVAKTAFNPFDVIAKFREILKERPYEFRYSLRIIPIEKVVRTDLSEIQRVAMELASSKIKTGESFRVTVEKRFTEVSTRDIIETVAANIENPVNLDNPEKIVLVEVIGGLTGLSIVKPNEILAIAKEKV
jgi:tRNA acetyltransferase TAN1